MKFASLLATLGLLALAGCVTPPAVTIAPTNTQASDRPASVVRPDQITPQTAQKMSQALADELDREAQREVIGTAIPKH
jgi:hypothetical protein